MTQTANWNDTKVRIKEKFGKLNDSEIEGLNGHMDRLQGLVQKTYSYSEDKAKQECKAFNESTKK